MTKRGLIALLCVVTLGLAPWACSGRKHRIRYRMTVVVDTPEGPRSGSVVRESTYHDPGYFFFPLGEDRGSVTVEGEAVVIDLPNGRTLFTLLPGVFGDNDLAAKIPSRLLGYGKSEIPVQSARLWPATKVDNLPRMVIFEDPRDYRSVKTLDHADFSKVFGPGYQLSTIYVERTDDPVTSSIATRLPNFGTNQDFREWMMSLPANDERIIIRSFFLEGPRHE